MPIYEYRCDFCQRKKEIFQHKTQPSKTIVCKCGRTMRKIISRVNTDLVENVRFSNTMGVNPRQIPEAEKRFPGSKYTPDGKLIVNSRKDKLQKMKERGYVEFE